MFKFIRPQKIFILVLLIIIIGAVFLIIKNQSQPHACFKKTCFNIELAQTDTARQAGLMDREPLKPNQGMLFIFPVSEQHPFWMKNMLQNIDIIFLDNDKRVNFIAANQLPCAADKNCPLITSPEDTRYVLELPAGTAKKLNLQIGSQWEHNIAD